MESSRNGCWRIDAKSCWSSGQNDSTGKVLTIMLYKSELQCYVLWHESHCCCLFANIMDGNLALGSVIHGKLCYASEVVLNR